eukprot:3744667-Amphidinium_carterae.1
MTPAMARKIAVSLMITGPAMIEDMSSDEIVAVWQKQGELFDSKLNLEVYGREVSAATSATAMAIDAKKMLDGGIESAKGLTGKSRKRELDEGDQRAALAETAERCLTDMQNSPTTGNFDVLTQSFVQIYEAIGADLDQGLYNMLEQFVMALKNLQKAGANPAKFRPAGDLVTLLSDLIRSVCSMHMRAYEKGKSL